MVQFRSTVILGGKNATGIEVPTEAVEALDSGKKPAVTVTIGSYTYRSTVAVYGGKFMLPLSAENRQAAGVASGDTVDVTLELDTQPREVEVPSELAAGLAAEPALQERFDKLSYSNKRRIALDIEGAKTPETRERRIAKALDGLRV